MANSSREDSVGEVRLENENLAFFLLAKNNRECALHILLTRCQAAAYYIIPQACEEGVIEAQGLAQWVNACLGNTKA